eukprot:350015-Chlamydomonas_euryale.AAC.9
MRTGRLLTRAQRVRTKGAQSEYMRTRTDDHARGRPCIERQVDGYARGTVAMGCGANEGRGTGHTNSPQSRIDGKTVTAHVAACAISCL